MEYTRIIIYQSEDGNTKIETRLEDETVWLTKRTTTELFEDCLHKYVITDAIRDENVLKFSVEYVGRYRKKETATEIDIEVEAINKKELMESPARLEKIADYILANHLRKTHNRDFTAMFCVNSIETLIKYYDILHSRKQQGKHNLNIATIYSYVANEEDADANGFIPDELSVAEEPRVLYAMNKDSPSKFIRSLKVLCRRNLLLCMELKTVLLIDDDQDDKLLFMEAVVDIDHGLKGITATNGIEALKILHNLQVPPDLILVDINMHLMAGLDCISLIKQSPKFRNIPFAIYSSEISEEHKAAAQEMGVYDFIKKPSTYQEIIDSIKNALQLISLN